MKDEYVTREEFKKAQEEIDMRFNYVHKKAEETAQEIDGIYPDIREWIDQGLQINVDMQRKLISELIEEKLREAKIL